MVKKQSIRDLVNQIDTVHGICPECDEEAILVAIVTDYYRCTNCGAQIGAAELIKGKRRKRPGRHSKKHRKPKKIERGQGHP